MSANNGINIKTETNEVFYQGCIDNEDMGDLIGQGKNKEEAIKIALDYIEKIGYLEYGLSFV